ncbi:MAG: endonuclease/exonuclease/phosphatase family protein [Bacteroidetes bacterium]|nr:endonuclease/exonuclease/phosphatase family protein [Bacteroidota bacterium]
MSRFFIFCLLLSIFAPYVSPVIFWPMAFFGLLHPFFVLLNFIFLIAWSFLKKRELFFSLGILLFSLPLIFRQLNFHFFSPAVPGNSFSLMSYNVKIFDLYKWSGQKNAREKMFALINGQRPDVLCLQEFFTRDSSSLDNLDSIQKMMHYPFVHVEYTFNSKGTDHYGVVTFSKFPILNKGKIEFNNRHNNICIYSDLLIQKDTVRIYNMHLQSIALARSDYKFLNEVSGFQEAQDEIESSKNILRRMKRAYTNRANQAESVAAHIAGCHYRIILCGDLNDTPVSYTYHAISYGFTDAFSECGSGFGKTFENPFPVPRIDYIFHDDAFLAYDFRVLRTEKLSDHYPVICKLAVKK